MKHLKRFLDWGAWLYGVGAAFIGGSATVVSAMVIAPETFNFQDLTKTWKLALLSGAINLAMFLKQSPLPKVEEVENETTDKPGSP